MIDAVPVVVGTSAVMRGVRARLRHAALSMDPVLLVGEVGTGKHLAAQTVHSLSARSAAPFVELNCGALSENVFEAEFSGYVKGALSGPHRPGCIALAAGGTLFLEDVGELSPASQIKLLRLLHEKEYAPLGGTETLKADVRVMASTSCSLPEMVNVGTFREDLHACLSALQIVLPPLRDRPGDLDVLVRHFLSTHGRLSASVTPGALARLAAMNWVGNVRDLNHFLQFLLAGGSAGEFGLTLEKAALTRSVSRTRASA